MGTWGAGPLDNDTAVDWMYGLGEVFDLSLIEGTLNRALAVGADYLEAPDAEEALAAAEAVARMGGNFGVRNDYTQTMDDWVTYMNRAAFARTGDQSTAYRGAYPGASVRIAGALVQKPPGRGVVAIARRPEASRLRA